MLISLDFLNPGSEWPPTSEKERLVKYQDNRDIFEGNHADVYSAAFKRIERVIGNFSNIISFHTIINYQKLISLKSADLLFGEPPNFSAGDEGSPEQTSIDTIIENSELINTGYEGIIDASRFGTGIFQIYQSDIGGIISVIPPGLWFPVVSEDNIKKILYHILAWKVSAGDEKYLKVQIHEKGKYTERLYYIDNSTATSNVLGDTIGKLISEEIFQTGLSDFAIIPFHNVLTSDRIYGFDDYSDIDSIISEILVRVSQISKILDKHADPSATGPAAAMVKDGASGEWKMKMGGYFPRLDNESPEVKYITWDGQLTAAFSHLEFLINALYTISEMGSAIFGDLSNKAGQIPSGSALKRLMISPLAKVNRMRMRIDPALKKAIKLCSELPGKNIKKLETVSITWQDGLPGDPAEEANIMQIRTAGKQTMSQKRALKTYDGLSEEEADNEISQIEEDETKSNPLAVSPFGGIAANEPDTSA